MAIKYVLHPNPLTSNPDDYRAMVRNQTSRSIDDIIDRMIEGGSTVTKADVLSVIEEFEAAVISFIEDGDSVNTSLFRISSSVAGNFSGLDDHFDADRHELRLNMKAGKRLRRAIGDMSLQKIEFSRRRPTPNRFIDHESGTSNQTLTPGGVGELRGKLLKLDPDDNRQGVFFIAADGTETKAAPLIRNKPSNLPFRDSRQPAGWDVQTASPQYCQKNIKDSKWSLRRLPFCTVSMYIRRYISYIQSRTLQCTAIEHYNV